MGGTDGYGRPTGPWGHPHGGALEICGELDRQALEQPIVCSVADGCTSPHD